MARRPTKPDVQPATTLGPLRMIFTAAARYHELVARHPEAFAHHAAGFWLTVGGDRSAGLRLLERDRASRCAAATSLDRAARAH